MSSIHSKIQNHGIHGEFLVLSWDFAKGFNGEFQWVIYHDVVEVIMKWETKGDILARGCNR